MRRKRYRSKLTDAEKDKIIALAEQGIAQKYIAERFNVSKSTVYRVIKEKRNEG